MRRSGRRLLEHPSRRETWPRSLRHEGVGSPRQSTFPVNRTNFRIGTLEGFAFGWRRSGGKGSGGNMALIALAVGPQPVQVIQKYVNLSVMAGLDPAIHAASAPFASHCKFR
jgi:hypothetical protein